MKSRNIGIILSYLNTGLNMVCGLFLSSFLLRVLGKTEYGIYQTISSFANYLVLLEFGTGTVMTRNITMCRARNANREEIQRNVTTIWMVACALSLVITGVSLVFYFNIEHIYASALNAEEIVHAKQIFQYAIIYLLCSFLTQTLNGIIMAHEHYRYASTVNIIRILARTALLTALVLYARSAIVIVQLDAALGIILLLISMAYIMKNFSIMPRMGRMDLSVLKVVAPLSVALFLQTIINQANNNVDKFLIGIMLSPESVSLYSVGMYVFSIFSTLTTIPLSMYAPSVISQIQNNVSRIQLQGNLVNPCRLTALIGGLVYFGFLACGRPFIEIFYGETYMQAWWIAIIVMTPMYVTMINSVLINVLDAYNLRLTRSFILLGTTILNILLTILWLNWWGEIGAALATALSTLIGQVVIMNIYYRKKLKIDVIYLFKKALSGFLPWLLIAGAIAFAVGLLIPSALIAFVVQVILYLGIFIGGYWLFSIKENEKAWLNKIVHRTQ